MATMMMDTELANKIELLLYFMGWRKLDIKINDAVKIIERLENNGIKINEEHKDSIKDFHYTRNFEEMFNWIYNGLTPYEVAKNHYSADVNDYKAIVELSTGECIFWYDLNY